MNLIAEEMKSFPCVDPSITLDASVPALRLSMFSRSLLALLIVVPVASAQELAADHAARMAKGLALFKSTIRPILEERCLKCHGGKSVESEFDLGDRDGLLKGGIHGKAIEPGKSGSSRLLKLVRHQQDPHMPKGGAKLADEQIAKLAEWIDLGAPYDQPLVASKKIKVSWTQKTISDDAKAFWSFQPLKDAPIPDVKNAEWCRNAIDRFLLSRMEAAGIAPSPQATKVQLLRRAYFDLIGLPPTPAEVDAFLNDAAPDAWPKVIDRLLARPQYGERWARHWLDLARYAESHGFEHDTDRPTAYHYRDFVIEALNSDLPYNTFVRWQIAGDEYEPANHLAMKATGFLAAGVHSTQITKSEAEKHRYDELDDKVSTIGVSMLGLSVGCARCHDHKYDPIPARDYYRMLSTFTGTVRSELMLDVDAKTKVKALVASENVKAVRLHTQGADFLPNTHFLRRGDVDNKEGVAEPGYLQVLMPSPEAQSLWLKPAPKEAKTPWKRRALAEWITDTDQGAGQLLARVIVNRLWQHHFGRGIVATPSDFGARGEPPTHPELLDHLARKLIAEGWSLKAMHKEMMTSAAYQQASAPDESKAKIDRDNKLIWRFPARRLEAEVIRDTLLAVAGELDLRQFGPGTLDENSKRRSIYFTVKRSKLVPMMVIFDAPEALGSMADRPTTTIAPQALHLMNNPTMRRAAKSLAARLEPSADPSAAIDQAYRLTLSRLPSDEERSDAVAFLREQAASYSGPAATQNAFADFCHVLLCLNEFVYVE